MNIKTTGFLRNCTGFLLIWVLKGKLLVPFTLLSTVRYTSIQVFR